jgi:hypothetical protein
MRAGIGETELANSRETSNDFEVRVALGHRPDSRLRRKHADAKQKQGFARECARNLAISFRATLYLAARLKV